MLKIHSGEKLQGRAGQGLAWAGDHSICPKFQHTGLRAVGAPYTDPVMEIWMQTLLDMLALPAYGLSTVFVVSFISATLLPMGSEPVVLGVIHLNPAQYWPVIAVATVGNTLGGALDYAMGRGAGHLAAQASNASVQTRALRWLHRLGPKACLLGWLPLVGDPLCTLAGWLKLPFWPCLAYMLIGKFLRYVLMTAAFFEGMRLVL